MRSNVTSARSTSPGFRIVPCSWPTGSRAGLSARFCAAVLAVRQPDLTHALEVGDRVYLREPSNRDQAEIVARNAASLALHGGWVNPPADARTFAEWMERCRVPNVQCFLVCRIDDGAIAGVFTLSQI